MKNLIKNILPNFLLNWHLKKTSKKLIKEWEKNGKKGVAPQLIKQTIITDYQRAFRLSTFIETGTYLGDMVFAQKYFFQNLISIELDEKLYEKAKARFKNDKHIKLYQGDSGVILQTVLKEINCPCLFWLDGHYSGGITSKGTLNTPILAELNTVLTQPYNHVVLIDDARLFTGENDYPTIEEIRQFVLKQKPTYSFEVKYDIIRIHE